MFCTHDVNLRNNSMSFFDIQIICQQYESKAQDNLLQSNYFTMQLAILNTNVYFKTFDNL